MPRQAASDWFGLAMDSTMLATEASLVIAMRTMQLLTLAPGHRAEATRMWAEKVETHTALALKLTAAGPQSPVTTARTAVAHYGRTVRANRKRLGKVR